MKILHYYLTVLSCFLAGVAQAQEFTVSPESPKAGETVSITYNPKGGPLDGSKAIEVIAYLFEEGDPTAKEISMSRERGIFSGNLTTTSKTKAVGFSITSTDGETKDDYDNRGYKLLITNDTGKGVVPGANAAKAAMYGTYNSLLHIDRDREKAYNLLQTEFRSHPESLDSYDYYSQYAGLVKRMEDYDAMAEMDKELKKTMKNKSASEPELQRAFIIAQTLEKKEETEKLKATIAKKHPYSTVMQNDLYYAFRDAVDQSKKLEIFNEYEEKFGRSETGKTHVDRMASSLAAYYSKEKDWKNFEKYLAKINDPMTKAGSLNGVAWEMSGESLEADAPNAAKGKELSMASLQAIEKAKGDISFKPKYRTEKHWKEDLESSYAMFSDTYALCAYHTGNYEEALKYQEIACKADDFGNAEMNERYVAYFEKTNSKNATEELLRSLIAKGAASSTMKEKHKELFFANNDMESAYAKYVAELERTALENMKEKVKGKMIEKDAPAFELVNLNGQTVSLESMKGKVVVLDFWATWCGPCKASFPGMQTAVNNYKDRNDVAFVFIDTWERVENKEQNAKDFIAEKGYSFNVLMDNDNATVAAYEVEGIPTKIIVDKNGKIRFKSIGYGGNNEELVRELELMIEMAGAEEAPTGTP